MKLNENLVRLRKEHSLSQADLAERLNVSRQAVSRWEIGTAVPSSDNLIYLSKLYSVTLDELVYGLENPGAKADYVTTERQSGCGIAGAKRIERYSQYKSRMRWIWPILCLIWVSIILCAVWAIYSFKEEENVTSLNEWQIDSLDISSAEHFYMN